MAGGILLLLACIGLGVVVFWVMANDKVGIDEPTRGLLAMPDPVKERNGEAAPGGAAEGRRDDAAGRSGR